MGLPVTPSTSANGPRPTVAHHPRVGRPAPELRHYVMFPFAGVERLVQLAIELGKPVRWVYGDAIALTVEGTAERCFAFTCRLGGQGESTRLPTASLGSHAPFSVPIPLVDLQSIFADTGSGQAIVVRLVGDSFTVGYIDAGGAVHFLEDEPTELIQRSDDLLLRIFQHAHLQGDLGSDVEDYLRERHLLVG